MLGAAPPSPVPSTPIHTRSFTFLVCFCFQLKAAVQGLPGVISCSIAGPSSPTNTSNSMPAHNTDNMAKYTLTASLQRHPPFQRHSTPAITGGSERKGGGDIRLASPVKARGGGDSQLVFPLREGEEGEDARLPSPRGGGVRIASPTRIAVAAVAGLGSESGVAGEKAGYGKVEGHRQYRSGYREDAGVWEALSAAYEYDGDGAPRGSRRKVAGVRDVLEAVMGLGYGAVLVGAEGGGDSGAMEASQV